nr:MG2 domain-containing protein [Burkholderiaceae bacterium]
IARVPGPLAAPGEDCGEDRPGHFVSARARDARGREDLSFTWSGWSQGIEPWRFEVPTLASDDNQIAAHTVFDRMLLRAGETVSMKHFVRGTSSRGLSRPADDRLPRRMKIVHTGTEQSWDLPLTWSAASAHAKFRLPPGARLGRYEVFLEYPEVPAQTAGAAQGGATVQAGATPAPRATPRAAPLWSGPRMTGSFRVEAFRLPVFDAQVLVPPVLPPAPREAAADVRINWLSGGSAARLPITVSAQMRAQPPVFEGWDAFVFDRPDLERSDNDDRQQGSGPQDAAQQLAARGVHRDRLVLDKLAAELDANGSARVRVPALPVISVPHRLELETTFADPSGEIQSVSRSTMMYPSQVVVGVKTDSWAAMGQSIGMRIAVLDTAGQPQKGRAVRVVGRLEKTISHRKRLVGGFYAYENQHQSRDLGEVCKARTEAGGVAICEISPKLAPGETGQLVLVAESADDGGRVASASASVWMAGRGEIWFDTQAQDRIDLIPEKKRLAPGETARFQVRMPFRMATALVTVEREGVIDSRVIELSGRNPSFELPMRADYGPNVFVSVLPIRGRLREVPWYSIFVWGWRSPIEWWSEFRHSGELPAAQIAPTATVDLARPAFRMGLTELTVGIDGSRLAVKVTPEREQYKVREKVKVSLEVRLPDGRSPAPGAQLAVAAVDEALLELLPNSSWKVLEAMLQRRGYGVETSTAQMQVVGRRHFGRKAVAAGGDGGRNPTRELFDTLLYWNPAVSVDAQGRAQIEVPLNDSLTRFRIVAIADADQGYFGTGEASVRSTQPLQLTAGLPLVVRDGDTLPVALTVRNNGNQPMKVTFNARVLAGAAGAAPITSVQRSIELAAGSSQLVPVPVVVPPSVEQLTWEIDASETGGQRDSLRVKQVVAPAVPLTVRQAMLMQIDGQAGIALATPPGALAGRSALRVSLSPSIAGSLGGVRDWLLRYPYRCLEQRTSRAVGLGDAAMWQTLLDELPSYIDSDGLAQFFPVRGGESAAGSEALTAYLLSVSREAGLDMPAALRDRLLGGLAAFVEGRIKRTGWSLRPDSQERRLAALAV